MGCWILGVKEPLFQLRATICGKGRIEEGQEGMGAGEIQVPRIGMMRGGTVCAFWNIGPIKAKPGELAVLEIQPVI